MLEVYFPKPRWWYQSRWQHHRYADELLVMCLSLAPRKPRFWGLRHLLSLHFDDLGKGVNRDMMRYPLPLCMSFAVNLVPRVKTTKHAPITK